MKFYSSFVIGIFLNFVVKLSLIYPENLRSGWYPIIIILNVNLLFSSLIFIPSLIYLRISVNVVPLYPRRPLMK